MRTAVRVDRLLASILAFFIGGCGLQDLVLFRGSSSLISPLLLTASGGTSVHVATAVGSEGTIWVAGVTTGDLGGMKTASNPAVGDAYVAKIDPYSGLKWVHQFQATDVFSYSLQVDHNENSYLSFIGTSAGATQLGVAGGSFDHITAKFDSSGALAWLIAYGNGVAVTASTAYDFTSVLDSGAYRVGVFNSTSFPGANLSGTGGVGTHLFASRLQTDGTPAWTREMGCTLWSTSSPRNNFVTSSGDLAVCGQSGSNAAAACFGTQTGASAAGPSAYLAVFHPDGSAPTVNWIRRTSNPMCSNNGNNTFYLSGETAQAIGTQFGTYSTNTNPILQQITISGTLNWTSQEGGGGATQSRGEVALDSDGTPYLQGLTAGTIGTQVGVHGAQDIYISQFNSGTGARVWSSQIGAGAGSITSPMVTGTWNYLVSGILAGTTDGVLSGTLHGSHGLQDIFFARVNNSGTLSWLHQFGGGGTTSASLANYGWARGSGYSYFLAEIGAPIVDSACSIIGTAGNNSLLIIKLEEQFGNLAWCKQIGAGPGSTFYFGTRGSLTLTGSGNLVILGSVTNGQLPNSTSYGSGTFLILLDSNGNI